MSKESNDERLKKMRARMREAQERSRGGGKYWSIPKDGSKNSIRILPEVGKMEPGCFWQVLGKHWKNRRPLAVCPQVTTEGTGHPEECPICAFATEKWNNGEKELARQWFAGREYRMNIIIRANNNVGYEGPYIWTPTYDTWNRLYELVESEQYGDISSVEEGFDLEVYSKKVGEKNKEYALANRECSPLLGTAKHPDYAAIEALMAQATDLTELTEHLPSYDELLELISPDLGDAEDDGESMFDDDLEEIDF